MREIKIRYVVETDNGIRVVEPLDIKDIEQNDVREGTHTKWNRIKTRNLYTGLKDKNGKEIYEGDILAYKDPNFEPTNVAVEWGDCGFILRWLWDNATSIMTPYPNHQFEVIGNIYENPDLLEAKDAKNSV